MKLKQVAATIPIVMLLTSPAVTPAAAPPAKSKRGTAVLCPTRVETAIRAIPKYKHLAKPTVCRYTGKTVWSFGNFTRGHSYLGKATVVEMLCTPLRLRCYVAKVTAFVGHLK